MLVIGAGGFAKEITEIFQQRGDIHRLAFYDDVTPDAQPLLFNRFPILRDEHQAKAYLADEPAFTIGIGNPILRYNLFQKFTAWGGVYTSTISPRAYIGSFDVAIGNGSNVLDGVAISNETSLGRGCIVYYHAIITHDSRLGDFVQLSPGAQILGGGIVDDFVMVGASATILPRLNIGKHAVIGAGAVVTKPVPDYALIMGNPARQTGWVSEYGDKLVFAANGEAVCKRTAAKYRLSDGIVEKIAPHSTIL